MEDNKRTRRTREEIVSELDKKILYHREQIVKLEEKKHNVLNPKPRKKSLTAKSIFDFAKSEGMSLKDIADKLGMNIDEV